MMILHYLGLDHIGHFAGPRSPLIGPKLAEMDRIISQMYSAMEKWVNIYCALMHSLRSTFFSVLQFKLKTKKEYNWGDCMVVQYKSLFILILQLLIKNKICSNLFDLYGCLSIEFYEWCFLWDIIKMLWHAEGAQYVDCMWRPWNEWPRRPRWGKSRGNRSASSISQPTNF